MKSLLAATLSVALVAPALAQLSRPAPPAPAPIAAPNQPLPAPVQPPVPARKAERPAAPAYVQARDSERCGSFLTALSVANSGKDLAKFQQLVRDYRVTCAQRGDRDIAGSFYSSASTFALHTFGSATEALSLADEGLKFDYLEPGLHIARADALIALKRLTEATAALASAESALANAESRTARTCAAAPREQELCGVYQKGDRATRSSFAATKLMLSAAAGVGGDQGVASPAATSVSGPAPVAIGPTVERRPCTVRPQRLQGTYEGRCSAGVAEGRGKAVGEDTYEGEFADGVPSGQGVYTFASGTRYEGRFAGGRPNGPGTLTRPGGQKLEGSFRDGRLHGVGTQTNAQGKTRQVERQVDKLCSSRRRDSCSASADRDIRFPMGYQW